MIIRRRRDINQMILKLNRTSDILEPREELCRITSDLKYLYRWHNSFKITGKEGRVT